MKKSTTIITALLVAATCHLLFCFTYDFFEEYGRTLPSRREQQRLACLNQAVRGYISDEDFDNAFFEAVLVEYHFVVGKYKGQFKLVNTAPKHLEIFLYKVNKVMESSKDCNSQIHSHLTC